MNKLLLLAFFWSIAAHSWAQQSQTHSYNYYDQQFAKEELGAPELKAYEARAWQKLTDYFQYLQNLAEYGAIPEVQQQYQTELLSLFQAQNATVFDYVNETPLTLLEMVLRAGQDSTFQEPVTWGILGYDSEFEADGKNAYSVLKKVQITRKDGAEFTLWIRFHLVHEKIDFDGEKKKVWKVYLGDMKPV